MKSADAQKLYASLNTAGKVQLAQKSPTPGLTVLLARDQNPTVRLLTLSNVGSGRLPVAEIVRLAKDEDEEVQRKAYSALRALGRVA